MFKVLERVQQNLHIISYIIILSFFSFIGVTIKGMEWKLLSLGLVLCSFIGLIFRFIIMRNVLKNESSSSGLIEKKQRMIFIEKLLGIVPIGIVFCIAAIYSIINKEQFLPMSTSILFLVAPPLLLINLLRSKKNAWEYFYFLSRL